MNTGRALMGFCALCCLILAIAHSFRKDWGTVLVSLMGLAMFVAIGTIKDEG